MRLPIDCKAGLRGFEAVGCVGEVPNGPFKEMIRQVYGLTFWPPLCEDVLLVYLQFAQWMRKYPTMRFVIAILRDPFVMRREFFSQRKCNFKKLSSCRNDCHTV